MVNQALLFSEPGIIWDVVSIDVENNEVKLAHKANRGIVKCTAPFEAVSFLNDAPAGVTFTEVYAHG